MRNPYYGKWYTDDDPAGLHEEHDCVGGWGWDLRDSAPAECGPVIVYYLSPEEIARRYGPPRPRQAATGMAGVAYQTHCPRPPMYPMTRDVLQTLATQGLTAEQIAQRLNRTAHAVRLRAKLWGIRLGGEQDASEA